MAQVGTVYLVGGAVRDQLLGIDNYDQDYVVVGATPEEMLKAGYQAVGKDFPVFLHPKTSQEYALARTERKSGQGYTGFECHFAPDVTLEEDLQRRDLTINAIAQDSLGKRYDPYGGEQDLNNRVLRHVSEAFSEDPLRVLRVARFAAKLDHLGFTIAAETQQLMKEIAQSGELKTLTPERVWNEWHKSLSTHSPQRFLEVLRDCGALHALIPEIDVLFGVPQPEKWHPEIDTGIHTLMVAKQAAELTDNVQVRFAAQVHDLGKGITPKEEWPSHKMHAQTGVALIKDLCERLKVPNKFKQLAMVSCKQHTNIHRAMELRPETFIKVLTQIDVWRKPEALEHVLLVCKADHQGRLGLEIQPYPQKSRFEQAFKAAQSVSIPPIIEAGFQGADIRQELDRRRLEAVRKALNPDR
ncbi:multifunctional CCA addition/repair protein [Vibrio ulleungensis]|uniref:Multifunctional CCA protein n=1 Tax=Vibrio ulleungensis TaxID=2807619 RepID=A0ABS2HNI5_9VIBR|nr:multifunctional CCA addition/repair protein [Vibrio ulleungensis]MBM7037441.1 multifunctional CCA addition/repair protein [Vibrio ulleungensis]